MSGISALSSPESLVSALLGGIGFGSFRWSRLACQSSLSPKVFGQIALQNCILPLLLPARVQTAPAPFCVECLRAVAAQAIHNPPSSRPGTDAILCCFGRQS